MSEASWRTPGGGRLAFAGAAAERDLLDRLVPHLDPRRPLDLRIAAERIAAPPATALRDGGDGDGGDIFRLSSPGAPPLLAIHDRRRRLTDDPRVFLQAEPDGRRFAVLLAEDDPYHLKLRRWFLIGLLAVFGALRFAHASAVGGGRGAALIVGGHGAGKSTLAAAAVHGGFELLAEGVALIAPAGRVVPFFMDGEAVLRLAPRSWERLRRALGTTPPALAYPAPAGGVEAKRVVRAAALGGGGGGGGSPRALAAVWLPAVGGPAEPGLEVERLARAAALAAAAPHLEDRRVTAMRRLLGDLVPAAAVEAHLRRRWREDFPAAAFRVAGGFDFGRLEERWAAGALGIVP